MHLLATQSGECKERLTIQIGYSQVDRHVVQGPSIISQIEGRVVLISGSFSDFSRDSTVNSVLFCVMIADFLLAS